jgi:hypothetical protein
MYDEAMKLVSSFHDIIVELYQQPDQLQVFVLSVSLAYMPTNSRWHMDSLAWVQVQHAKKIQPASSMTSYNVLCQTQQLKW